jgi:hypothetical protein
MDKLEQLEKSLKEYKELLEKGMTGAQTGMPSGTAGGGSAVNTTMPMGVEKAEDKEDQIEEADEARDKKKDKKMIEKELDEHNEKKHGEAKDADTAMKTELIKFDSNGQWSMAKASNVSEAESSEAKVKGKAANYKLNSHYGDGGSKSGAGASPAGNIKDIDPKSGKTIKETNPFKKD